MRLHIQEGSKEVLRVEIKKTDSIKKNIRELRRRMSRLYSPKERKFVLGVSIDPVTLEEYDLVISVEEIVRRIKRDIAIYRPDHNPFYTYLVAFMNVYFSDKKDGRHLHELFESEMRVFDSIVDDYEESTQDIEDLDVIGDDDSAVMHSIDDDTDEELQDDPSDTDPPPKLGHDTIDDDDVLADNEENDDAGGGV